MNTRHLLLVFCLFLGLTATAQNQKEKMSREDKEEKNQARLDRINIKNDIALFRKQILALKEYAQERLKIPALQKSSKMVVKVIALVDSEATDNGVDSKTLIGYIRQDVGDNSTNMYELTFDRSQRKIVSVKRTPEAIDADRELADEKEEKATTKKSEVAKKPDVAKKPVVKKNKDDDEDDDPDEEKPVKGKQKDEDD